MMNITTEARSELKRFTQEELEAGEFVRIARSYQCGGSKFQLTIDDEQTPMDELVTVDGIHIVIEKTCLDLLKDAELDFNENGFLFLDDLGNQC